MNRLVRNIVLLGAVIIAILLMILYFASNRVLQGIQSHLNQSMESARIQIEQRGIQHGIQKLDYTSFECSGFINYTCKSKTITLYIDNFAPTHHNTHKAIRFHNLTLSSEDIKSKNQLSFKVKTNIEYPTTNHFFSDSQKDTFATFFNHSIDSILPHTLECTQDYLAKTDIDTRYMMTANTKCNFTSQIFDMQFESINLFTPDERHTHIIGMLYSIAAIMHEYPNKEESQMQNISHDILSLKFNIKPKQSIEYLIANSTKLTLEQKTTLKRQFEANLKLMKLVATPFLSPYLGTNAQALVQGLDNVAQNKTKGLDIELMPKSSPHLRPLNTFKNMNTIEWLNYLSKNYNITIRTRE